MMQQWYNEWVNAGFNDEMEFSDYDAQVALPIPYADLATLPYVHDAQARYRDIIGVRPILARVYKKRAETHITNNTKKHIYIMYPKNMKNTELYMKQNIMKNMAV